MRVKLDCRSKLPFLVAAFLVLGLCGHQVSGEAEGGGNPPLPKWAKISPQQIQYAVKSGLAATRELDLGGGEKIRLVLIPPGTFRMGSKLSTEEVMRRWPGAKMKWFKWDRPRRIAKITKPFYIGVTEVTRGQFKRFVAASGHKTAAEEKRAAWVQKAAKSQDWAWKVDFNWKKPGFAQTDAHPVVCVAWIDCIAFCSWAGKPSGMKVRLPSEAEWEYACRAGSNAPFWWGDREEDAADCANVASVGDPQQWKNHFKGKFDGHSYTAPVASYRANGFGLHDMLGNVAEWCMDWFYPSDIYHPCVDNFKEYFYHHIVRGGGFGENAWFVRSGKRMSSYSKVATSDYGFRIVIEPVGTKPTKKKNSWF